MKARMLIVVLAALAVVGMTQAAVISVNLTEGSYTAPRANQTVLPTDAAGLAGYEAINWNNVQEDATGALLVDNFGVSTGSIINFAISNVWGDNSADGTVDAPNDLIARGYFDDGDTTAGAGNIGVDIEVTNVPYDIYDVVVYLSTDWGTSYTDYTANGVTGTTTITLDSFAAVGGWVLGQNVIILSNVTGATLDLEVLNRYADDDGNTRGCVAGIQIVEVPEPATLCLLGLGGIAMLRRKRA